MSGSGSPTWLFPYVEDPSSARPGRKVLRPVVVVRLVGPAGEAPVRVIALVDSGSEHTLATPMLARAVGIDPDPATETQIGIGGKRRDVRFADVQMQLFSSSDGDDEPLVTWDTEIGFFNRWEPPWAVLLGQIGFFDRFTVTMSRSATTLAVEGPEIFDQRFDPYLLTER